jgi:hypothetical protein
MKYIKLFEDNQDPMDMIGRLLGIQGHANSFELILDWVSRSLNKDPDSLGITQLGPEKDSNWSRETLVSPGAFGVSADIRSIETGVSMTQEEYEELRVIIRELHPEWYTRRGELKYSKYFYEWSDEMQRLKSPFRKAIVTTQDGRRFSVQ